MVFGGRLETTHKRSKKEFNSLNYMMIRKTPYMKALGGHLSSFGFVSYDGPIVVDCCLILADCCLDKRRNLPPPPGISVSPGIT